MKWSGLTTSTSWSRTMSFAWTAHGPFLFNARSDSLPGVQTDVEALEVQQDLGDVLLDAFDGGVLVEHAVDVHLRDRAAGHGREKDPTQRVAQRMPETPVQGLDGDLRRIRPDLPNIDDVGLQELGGARLHRIPSVLAGYFE